MLIGIPKNSYKSDNSKFKMFMWRVAAKRSFISTLSALFGKIITAKINVAARNLIKMLNINIRFV